MNKALEHLKNHCLELGMETEPEDLFVSGWSDYLYKEVPTKAGAYCVIYNAIGVDGIGTGYNVMINDGKICHFDQTSICEVEEKKTYVRKK